MYNTVGAPGEFFPLASIEKRQLIYYLLKREKLRYLNVVYSLANSRSVFQQPEKKEKLKQRAYRSNDVQFIQQGVWKFIFPSKFKRGSMFCDSRKKNSPKRHVTVVEY